MEYVITLRSTMGQIELFNNLQGIIIIISKYRIIGLMSRVFANGPGDRDSIPDRVIPKTEKWYLIPPCLALSIIR